MQEAMKKVDLEMKRSDELLSQMIPKAVAEKVKKGLNPVDTCEVSMEISMLIYRNFGSTLKRVNTWNAKMISNVFRSLSK